MTYYQVCRLFAENGWTCVKHYDDKETWAKDNKTVVVTVQDNLPRKLVESIMASA